jgi:hypothetical protein
LGSKRGKSDWGFAETGSGGNDELYCVLDAEWAASVNGVIENVGCNAWGTRQKAHAKKNTKVH